MSELISQNQESWDAGFRAAVLGEKWTDSHGFNRLSYSSGWAEGVSKRNGFPSRHALDSEMNVVVIKDRP